MYQKIISKIIKMLWDQIIKFTSGIQKKQELTTIQLLNVKLLSFLMNQAI